MSSRRTVLVVEDDEAMAVALGDGFASEGARVLRARDGVAGLDLASNQAVDIVILDVMLPRMSGLDVCRRLRQDGNNVPIIMLTARGQEIDRVVGLRSGADDYVTKPFSFLELLARVEAVLRRASGGRNGDGGLDRYVLGRVTLDFKRLEARRDEEEVELTPREFGLLRFFICHEGEVLSRDKLLDAVWGYAGSPLTRTVDTHIAKLRKKIEENPNDPRHIVTVHRVGYKFVAGAR
ncbi:MAG: response regulator transcription factor [Vicinamibacteria bacterium]